MRILKNLVLATLAMALCLAFQLPAAAEGEEFLIQDGVIKRQGGKELVREYFSR